MEHKSKKRDKEKMGVIGEENCWITDKTLKKKNDVERLLRQQRNNGWKRIKVEGMRLISEYQVMIRRK